MITSDTTDLGRLERVFVIAPVYMQRAVFLTLLSFIFFIAMMFAFYLRQHLGYFLLATAFLFVYLVTMFSWVIQRRSEVKIYERGIEYRKFIGSYSDITAVERASSKSPAPLVIRSIGRKAIRVPGSINEIDELQALLERRVAGMAPVSSTAK